MNIILTRDQECSDKDCWISSSDTEWLHRPLVLVDCQIGVFCACHAIDEHASGTLLQTVVKFIVVQDLSVQERLMCEDLVEIAQLADLAKTNMSTYQRPACRSDEMYAGFAAARLHTQADSVIPSDALINGVARYDPASAAVLEEYLSTQIKDDSYDCMANLALLKLCVQSSGDRSRADAELLFVDLTGSSSTRTSCSRATTQTRQTPSL